MTEANPGELTQEIGRSFVDAAPPGWTQGSIVYRRVGKTAESMATARTREGAVVDVDLGRPVSRALKDLRAATARPGAGAWFTAVAQFTADGHMTWDFDYDHEPAWVSGISPLHYLEEQQQFPRDPAHTPEWMQHKLRQAEELGGL